MAPFIYPTKDAPRYIAGHAVTLAMVTLAVIIYAIMSFYLRQQNQRRKAGKEHGKLVGRSDNEVAELGDESPKFMYTY